MKITIKVDSQRVKNLWRWLKKHRPNLKFSLIASGAYVILANLLLHWRYPAVDSQYTTEIKIISSFLAFILITVLLFWGLKLAKIPDID